MDALDVVIALVVAVAAFALWVVATAMFIWFERRLIAKMQTRIGPNRLGPLGLFQTLADGAKMFFKEDITPTNADRWVYLLAPLVAATVSLLAVAVVPFGGSFALGERTVTLQVWDPEIGLLWILAMSSLSVYGIVLAGWASGSKYPLLGGVRSSAQMISYELAMSLGLAAVFVWTGSLRTSDVVAAQDGVFFGFIPAWNILPQLLAFVLFFAAAVAETQRPPFDLPEAEGELVAGFHTEYSGAKFAMFMLAEFMAAVTMSAVVVTLFFGGPGGPVPAAIDGTIWGALLGTVYFLLKVIVFLYVFVWFRATLPRFRYDRLMDLGWRVLLPLGLLWVLATAAIVVGQETLDRATLLRYVGIGAAIAVLLFVVAPLFGRRPAPAGGEDGGGGGGGGPAPAPEGDGGEALAPSADSAREAADERTPDRVSV